jgi:hypothetical protein
MIKGRSNATLPSVEKSKNLTIEQYIGVSFSYRRTAIARAIVNQLSILTGSYRK